MKVAVFTKNNELASLHEENIHVIIFNMEEDKVVGVENRILEKHTNHSIINWLYYKSINQIYIMEIDDQVYLELNSKGVKVKTLESLKNDKLYNTLALSTIKQKSD